MAKWSLETHKSYNVSFKLKAVEVGEEKSKNAAARQFNGDPRENGVHRKTS